MDISAYSLVMAVAWFSVAALIGSLILPRITKNGLAFLAVLFALALFRIFVPLEFEYAYILRDEDFYPGVQDWLASPFVGSLSGGACLLLVWAVGILISLLLLVRALLNQRRFCQPALFCMPGSRVSNLAKEIKRELGFRGDFTLATSPKATSAYLSGFLHPCIVLPSNIVDFTDQDIGNMLRHELCHFMRGDQWLMLCLMLLRCFLWWNPTVYPLYFSVEQMLELRCDLEVCDPFSEEDRVGYLQTLERLAEGKVHTPVGASLGFLGRSRAIDAKIIQRFKIILAGKPTITKMQLTAGYLVAVMLFCASYSFTYQPYYATPGSDVVEGDVLIISPETAYIVHTPDGMYFLYYEGTLQWPLFEEALEKDPYNLLPIYEGGLQND